MTMVIIAGFHRSGTSMVARMLHSGGLFLGDDLLPAHISNRYGHFEDRQVVEFHDRVLMDNATTWQFDGKHSDLFMSDQLRDGLNTLVRERDQRRNWGFKDPRVCLFLKNWIQANPECFIVAIFRDFISTTQSLLKRHASDLVMGRIGAAVHLRFWQDHELAYRMWLAYNNSLLEAICCFPEKTLPVYHSQVLAGMDVPAAVDARIKIGMSPVVVRELIDLEITQTTAAHLPPIGAELLADLVQTWRNIETVCGSSGLMIDDVARNAFAPLQSGKMQPLGESIAEFNDATSRYGAAWARFRKRHPHTGADPGR
jgi:hypothetical protein